MNGAGRARHSHPKRMAHIQWKPYAHCHARVILGGAPKYPVAPPNRWINPPCPGFTGLPRIWEMGSVRASLFHYQTYCRRQDGAVTKITGRSLIELVSHQNLPQP